MDDKTFGLLEKMYADIKGEFKNIKEILKDKADKTDIVRIENEHGKKLDALFDGYKQTYEKLQEHDKRFDDFDTKLDNLSIQLNSHESKLKVFGGGKK